MFPFLHSPSPFFPFFLLSFQFSQRTRTEKACYAGYKPLLLSICRGLWGWVGRVPQGTLLGTYLSRSSHPHFPGLCQR